MTQIEKSVFEPITGRAPHVRRRFDALRIPQTQPGFWILYSASAAVDFGLCLYFFSYPLFLVEHSISVRSIGIITATLTAGILTGTIVIGILARHISLRLLLLTYVFLAPLALAARTQFLAEPAQLGFSFLAGATMSLWSVSFPPAIASLTSENGRGQAFSLFMATSIGSGSLAGIIGGSLPGAVRKLNITGAQDGIRIVLLLACACISLAAIGVVRLSPCVGSTVKGRVAPWNSFLLRFLAAIAVWNFAISFFTPFANVYLARQMGLSTGRIGTIYAASQLLQVAAILAAPFLYRRAGLVTGIAITQSATTFAIWALARTDGMACAVGFYLLLTALQWMSGPGISTLLMNRTSPENRSTATAMHIAVNLGSQALAAAVAGRTFEGFGYSGPLAVDGVIAMLASFLLYALLQTSGPSVGA